MGQYETALVYGVQLKATGKLPALLWADDRNGLLDSGDGNTVAGVGKVETGQNGDVLGFTLGCSAGLLAEAPLPSVIRLDKVASHYRDELRDAKKNWKLLAKCLALASKGKVKLPAPDFFLVQVERERK